MPVARLGRLRWRPEEAHLASPTVGLVRRRLAGLFGREAAAVVSMLEAADAHCVVLGGWGVDALVGRRTRRHGDLDLAVDDGTGADLSVADGALRAAGFGLVRRETVAAARFAERALYEDRLGRLVDLHPAALVAESRCLGRGAIPRVGERCCTVGRIGRSEVRCLSAAEQLELRREFQERAVDRRDLALLEQLALG